MLGVHIIHGDYLEMGITAEVLGYSEHKITLSFNYVTVRGKGNI